MRIIYLTKGQCTIVDDGDYGWAMQWKWHAGVKEKDCKSIYARRSVRSGNSGYSIYLHREILHRKIGRDLAVSEMGDHRNGNTLDNRQENLRPANSLQNARNQAVYSNSSSGLKGVIFSPQYKKYKARIYVNKSASGWATSRQQPMQPGHMTQPHSITSGHMPEPTTPTSLLFRQESPTVAGHPVSIEVFTRANPYGLRRLQLTKAASTWAHSNPQNSLRGILISPA